MVIREHGSAKNGIWLEKHNPQRGRVLARILLVVFISLITLLPILNGCSNYKSFSTGEKQLDFSFEYPSEWDITIVESYSDLTYADIVGPKTQESAMKASFNVWLHPEKDALSMLKDNLISDENRRKFNLISQDTISLHGFLGFRAQYSYDAMSNPHDPVRPLEERSYIPVRIMDITVARNDKIYEIEFSARQNEWNTREKDIQHILNTFKWK